MGRLRSFSRDRRGWALLIVAAALWLRLLVPAGFMIGTAGGAIGIMPCPAAASAAMAMPGMSRHGGDGHGEAGRPCPYAALAAPALGGADPVRIAAPIAFVPAPGPSASPTPAGWRSPRLRPPLRGPPTLS